MQLLVAYTPLQFSSYGSHFPYNSFVNALLYRPGSRAVARSTVTFKEFIMKAPLLAAAIATLAFTVPAFADCGKAHPQAQSASSTVVAQSSDSSNSPSKSDEGNQQQSSDDDDDN